MSLDPYEQAKWPWIVVLALLLIGAALAKFRHDANEKQEELAEAVIEKQRKHDAWEKGKEQSVKALAWNNYYESRPWFKKLLKEFEENLEGMQEGSYELVEGKMKEFRDKVAEIAKREREEMEWERERKATWPWPANPR